MLVAGIGADGQRRLGGSSVLIVGCGALGTVIADAMVRAGVGTVVIADRDIVERTNLQRQVLFDERDAAAGSPKAEAAAARLGAVNSEVRVVPLVVDVTARNAEELVSGSFSGLDAKADVVLDGTDNFSTRYLLNDVCVKRGVPFVYGAAVSTGGMTMTVVPSGASPTPCLRCIFPDPPAPGSAPTCDTAGILGPVAGIVGAMQAAEAIKLLLDREDQIARGLRQIDLWTNVLRTIDAGQARRAGPDVCPCCGLKRFDFLSAAVDDSAILCGADSVQITPSNGPGGNDSGPVDLAALARRLAPHGAALPGRHMLRATIEREEIELTVFRDGRAIVRGTREPARAKAIYVQYIGM